ncbi:MAG: hypothetical protein CL424_06215 [Acidimicrobiaceae bacterium]|nr:hypothetical protein [Acidimicrobiaceae bacterium]
MRWAWQILRVMSSVTSYSICDRFDVDRDVMRGLAAATEIGLASPMATASASRNPSDGIGVHQSVLRPAAAATVLSGVGCLVRPR